MFVILPTGGGILVILVQPDLTVIISPLQSLIEDQISRCVTCGTNSAFAVGEMTDTENRSSLLMV